MILWIPKNGKQKYCEDVDSEQRWTSYLAFESEGILLNNTDRNTSILVPHGSHTNLLGHPRVRYDHFRAWDDPLGHPQDRHDHVRARDDPLGHPQDRHDRPDQPGWCGDHPGWRQYCYILPQPQKWGAPQRNWISMKKTIIRVQRAVVTAGL